SLPSMITCAPVGSLVTSSEPVATGAAAFTASDAPPRVAAAVTTIATAITIAPPTIHTGVRDRRVVTACDDTAATCDDEIASRVALGLTGNATALAAVPLGRVSPRSNVRGTASTAG